MSDADAATDAEGESVRAPYPSLGKPFRSRPDAEMNAIGWALFVGLVALLLPFLPLVVLVWVLSKVVEAVAQRGQERVRGS
ncbi:MAG: hypothetical protein ABEJ61_02855 [Haloferacaceae archaeon]